MILAKRHAFYAIPLVAALLLAGCKPDKSCMQSCMAQHNCDLSFENNPHILGGECLIDQNKCESQCSGWRRSTTASNADEMRNRIPITLPPPVEIKPGPYGAVAYDKNTGAWGMSDPAADKKSAATSALDYCRQHGQGCVVADYFFNTCAAVASGVNNVVTWARGALPPVARAKAQEDCARKSNDSCTVHFWKCYSDSSAPKAEGNSSVPAVSLPPAQ